MSALRPWSSVFLRQALHRSTERRLGWTTDHERTEDQGLRDSWKAPCRAPGFVADLFLVKQPSGRRATDVQPPATIDIWIALRVTLVVLAVAGGLWVAYALGSLILLLIFSVLFAYLVAPLVAFVQRRLVLGRRRRALPRAAAIGIVYVVLFGGLLTVVSLLSPHLTDAAMQVPQRIQGVASNGQALGGLYEWLERFGISRPMVSRAVSAATGTIEAGAQWLTSAFVRAAGYLPWLVLIPILAFFLLKDAQTLRSGAIALLPQQWQARGPALLDQVDAALAAYIRAQLVACLIVGSIVGVGFAILRVPFAVGFGVAAGIAEFVPLVGPLVIAVAAAVTTAFQSPMAVVWVLLFLAVLRVLEDYVIYPRLVGSTVHLHPLAVILAVLAGAELGGVAGVLLSVPCLAIGSVVLRSIWLQRNAARNAEGENA